jgi:hypothetical protein
MQMGVACAASLLNRDFILPQFAPCGARENENEYCLDSMFAQTTAEILARQTNQMAESLYDLTLQFIDLAEL